MGKDWKYIFYLALLASLLLFVLLGKDKQYDWQVTYAHEDKNPYGGFALSEMLPSLFNNKPVEHRYKTFYELKDSLSINDNFLVISGTFNPDAEDANALIRHVQQGGRVLVAANYIYGKLADTLGLRTYDYFFEGPTTFQGNRNDTSTLRFINPRMDTTTLFYFKRDNIHNFIAKADTAFIKNQPMEAQVIVRNDLDKAVAVRLDYGKGYFVFCSTPMLFTNIYLLYENNHVLVSSLLSYLPVGKTYWTEYYHLGRMEAATPLRFILTNEPLRWAYYIGILSLIGFLIFESKRTQRIIPVVKPLANSSLDFIGTISKLFYEKADHKSIATKKILFFLEQVRSRYYVGQPYQAEGFSETLAHKTGVSQSITSGLVSNIHGINAKEKISKEELLQLNEMIQKFWKEAEKI
jgi:hypothetical protein